ncbi:hypothetical protein SAMN04488095_1495 [Jannaschia pohangensis]|uniref:Uncharacterized protein n=2 Tax=Jannaschia pohangensis TaxID=390807 RepID=A0A1I3LEI4_9RHOB|nr:hypothetical protein SAMN04488095_1495 [Jannaschia pohangensis]
MHETFSRRAFAGLSLGGMAGLAGCAVPDPLGEEQREMGDFQLALAITVAENAKKIPPTRDASTEDWKRVMNAEIERRFGRYSGGKDYIIALNIDGYALAPPGIPVVLTPKSILVVSANLWTAEPQEKISGPEQITTFEGADTLFLGSGLMKTADEQMVTLARNMARKVQAWMLRTPEVFGLPT